MSPRTRLAVIAGRTTSTLSRRLGRGGGTALPGLVAERLDPAVVANLGRGLGAGRIVVTGTNGKTTTARVVASILAAAGRPCVHNREGSNMMRGLASTLVMARTPDGHARTTGLFEVDEATMPAAVAAVQPRILAFTNLFRDQLDRYGEVDTVAALWREALAKAPPDATLVLNADDPSVAELAVGWSGPIHWYGLDDDRFATDVAGATDARWCRSCGGDFRYTRRYFAHIGSWTCAGCGRQRPETQTTARGIRLELERCEFEVEGLGAVALPLTGLYNVSNALAAIGVARVLGTEEGAILAGLRTVEAAFGRQERVDLAGRHLWLLLTKNPAGANQVVRLLREVAPASGARVAWLLNDRFADGRDVSWTWDVDYELLRGQVAACWAAGDRAEDMAVRLKYAGLPAPLATVHEPSALLDSIIEHTIPGDTVFLIPTYTAMLDLRAELVRRGAAAPFWEAAG